MLSKVFCHSLFKKTSTKVVYSIKKINFQNRCRVKKKSKPHLPRFSPQKSCLEIIIIQIQNKTVLNHYLNGPPYKEWNKSKCQIKIFKGDVQSTLLSLSLSFIQTALSLSKSSLQKASLPRQKIAIFFSFHKVSHGLVSFSGNV